jgi:hypothetical protein
VRKFLEALASIILFLVFCFFFYVGAVTSNQVIFHSNEVQSKKEEQRTYDLEWASAEYSKPQDCKFNEHGQILVGVWAKGLERWFNEHPKYKILSIAPVADRTMTGHWYIARYVVLCEVPEELRTTTVTIKFEDTPCESTSPKK